MKINMSTEMVDLLEGKVFQEEGKNLTLGKVCARALITLIPGLDDHIAPETVFENRVLGGLLLKGGEHELDSTRIAALHKRIVKCWIPDVAGQAYAILEGKHLEPVTD